MAQFAESPYRFTDPIRYFKANDPIYYEVDNIPLKQLQENNLWLKDQLAKLEYTQVFNTTSVNQTTQQIVPQGRAGFTELQPYVNNSDNRVYVRSGRFTARINDVLNLQPLQIINKLSDQNYINLLEFKTNRDGVLRSVLDKFKTQLEANAVGMNGLIERCFTKASKSNDLKSQYLSNSTPGYTSLPSNVGELPYPGTKGQLHVYNLATSSLNSDTFKVDTGTASNPWQESNWIKKWRGVARTAVVDVPQDLVVEIPPFTQADFYYTDENGVRQTLNSANQRIDLLFIYSKPIDSSAVSIAKFPTGSTGPTKIYTPQLGIVKGAGIGLNLDRRDFNPNNIQSTINLQDAEGNQMIVPSISDELGANLGVTGVKGSFPSPDDLLNLAPTLSEDLESNHIALLGQSVLPIAYIVVRKNAELNSNSSPIINQSDVIDIRPFFRTTELAYNERAGIAAAHPQVSLANPVATEVYVDQIAKELSDRINSLPTGGNSGGNTGGGAVPTGLALVGGSTNFIIPRVLAAGTILGGTADGVEGVLYNWIGTQYPNEDPTARINRLRNDFCYPQGLPITQSPTWDISQWAQQLTNNPGAQPYDWINDGPHYDPGPLNVNWQWNPNISTPGGSRIPPFEEGGAITVLFVAKEIKVDISSSNLFWAKDYRLNLQFLNCHPITKSMGGLCYSKYKQGNFIVFTIYAFWDNPATDGGETLPILRRTRGANYQGFVVNANPIYKSLPSGNSQNRRGPSAYGVCTYPTVYFEVVGIPENFGQSQSLDQNNILIAR